MNDKFQMNSDVEHHLKLISICKMEAAGGDRHSCVAVKSIMRDLIERISYCRQQTFGTQEIQQD